MAETMGPMAETKGLMVAEKLRSSICLAKPQAFACVDEKEDEKQE